jgi:CheY-like chemotaxis protein
MTGKQPSDHTILVVDDEEDVRNFLMDILEDVGFQVICACDGVEALERVKEQPPDLISLDLVMPNKSGIRFLHELRRDPRWAHVPVVVVTAHAHDAEGGQDFDEIFGGRSITGPKFYMEKPVSPESYGRLVCESLGLELTESEDLEDGDRMRGELSRLAQEATPEELAEALRLLKKGKR